MSSEENERKQEEEVTSRFFDLETDERLKPPTDLPDPPEVKFKRPDTKTANPNRETDGFRVGGSAISGSDLRGMGLASSLGVGLVAAIAVGTGLGYLVDYLLKNKGTPWGLITGFFLGVTAGFIQLIRTANQITNDTDKK